LQVTDMFIVIAALILNPVARLKVKRGGTASF
jgi:hypothetical protein